MYYDHITNHFVTIFWPWHLLHCSFFFSTGYEIWGDNNCFATFLFWSVILCNCFNSCDLRYFWLFVIITRRNFNANTIHCFFLDFERTSVLILRWRSSFSVINFLVAKLLQSFHTILPKVGAIGPRRNFIWSIFRLFFGFLMIQKRKIQNIRKLFKLLLEICTHNWRG